eukprot:SM000006S19557  [mRNA]  locus=s6:1464839:1465414:- [translate_table: standard]
MHTVHSYVQMCTEVEVLEVLSVMVRVSSPGQLCTQRAALVIYLGPLVLFEEGVSVKGVRYFTCPANHGAMLWPNKVQPYQQARAGGRLSRARLVFGRIGRNLIHKQVGRWAAKSGLLRIAFYFSEHVTAQSACLTAT